jgi:hypothetical protein
MKNPSKIERRWRWSLYAGAALLLHSGAGLGWGPLAEAPAWAQAWQVWLRPLHGALALLALAGLGALAGHVLAGWGARRNRVMGSLLLATLAVLAVSAWMLYYASPGPARDLASRAHACLGYALLPLLALHIVTGRASKAAGGRR